MDLHDLTIKNAKEKLQKKEISSVELTKAYLERIKKLEPKLHAFVTVTEIEALKMAANADKKLLNNDDSPLLGIPFSLKDNFNAKDVRTTASSLVLDTYISPYSST